MSQTAVKGSAEVVADRGHCDREGFALSTATGLRSIAEDGTVASVISVVFTRTPGWSKVHAKETSSMPHATLQVDTSTGLCHTGDPSAEMTRRLSWSSGDACGGLHFKP